MLQKLGRKRGLNGWLHHKTGSKDQVLMQRTCRRLGTIRINYAYTVLVFRAKSLFESFQEPSMKRFREALYSSYGMKGMKIAINSNQRAMESTLEPLRARKQEL